MKKNCSQQNRDLNEKKFIGKISKMQYINHDHLHDYMMNMKIYHQNDDDDGIRNTILSFIINESNLLHNKKKINGKKSDS